MCRLLKTIALTLSITLVSSTFGSLSIAHAKVVAECEFAFNSAYFTEIDGRPAEGTKQFNKVTGERFKISLLQKKGLVFIAFPNGDERLVQYTGDPTNTNNPYFSFHTRHSLLTIFVGSQLSRMFEPPAAAPLRNQKKFIAFLTQHDVGAAGPRMYNETGLCQML